MGVPIPVIDLFAGPGGLGEGFSSVEDSHGDPVFQVVMSIEMEKYAHDTLRLRSFARKIFRDGAYPSEYLRYVQSPTKKNRDEMIARFPEEWEQADTEALQATLKEGDDTLVDLAKERLDSYPGYRENRTLVLIGGPPCQAYSLVGRARRTHDQEKLQADVKQTLYKCYLRFIEVLKPTVFVMENVKGILSAVHYGHGVFANIERDMREAGYSIYSLATEDPEDPKDFVVHAENYGIPQARHRVILLGIRNGEKAERPGILEKAKKAEKVTVSDALRGIPAVRSGLSRRSESQSAVEWAPYVKDAARRLLGIEECAELKPELTRVIEGNLPVSQSADTVTDSQKNNTHNDWYRGRLKGSRILLNHHARNHMPSDLDRYLFCAAFADHHGRVAKLYDFPIVLLPHHKNVEGIREGKEVIFPDRFHVQLAKECSTTVTSHISKDGHYFIHPDYMQCRSLTVREAARLQTFPDDYFFEGNRTVQFQQVGNAVPPLLAKEIATIVASYLELR